MKKKKNITELQYSLYIGKKIKVLRDFKHYTQDTLAEKLDTSRQLICNIENGKSTPSSFLLCRLIRELNADLLEFFDLNNIEIDNTPKQVLLNKIKASNFDDEIYNSILVLLDYINKKEQS